MKKVSGWCLGALLLVASPLAAQEPSAPRLVKDLWDSAYLDGVRTGYVHTTVVEIERDGRKVLRTTLVLGLTLKRFTETIQTHVESGTEETPEGKVRAVFLRQALGKEQHLVLNGTVDGTQIHIKVDGKKPLDRKFPWDESAIGLSRELGLFKEKAVKPGDSFEYVHFEPMIMSILKVRVSVKDYEEIEIDGVKKKLLRAEALPDRIEGTQLPRTLYWLDNDRAVVRTFVDMPGFGKLVTVRTTKEAALKGVTPATLGDIGVNQLLPLNRRVLQPHDANLIVFKISLPEDADPATAFATDDRQSVKNVRNQSFELHVKAIRQPDGGKGSDVRVGDEYLRSNFYINSDDAKVKELSRTAVGDETNAWKKAVRIEKWVKANMKVRFSESMATADHAARTLEGDCSECAMLAAAMCRAAGIPARTAIGYTYADVEKGPVLAFHMWTEVFVQGRWMAIDGMLGRGSVGAVHVKINDTSWNEGQSVKPLFPLMRVLLGKPAIEVLRVEGAN